MLLEATQLLPFQWPWTLYKKCSCCLPARRFPLDNLGTFEGTREALSAENRPVDVKRGLSGFAGYDRSMLSAYTPIAERKVGLRSKVLLQSDSPCYHRLDIR